MFINGVQSQILTNTNGTISGPASTVSITGTPTLSGSTLYLNQNIGGTAGVSGYVADVRVVTGAALYTSGFTVPSAPLSTSATGVTQALIRAGANAPYVSNGALTFDRGLKQFANFGAKTFNIATRGFTAVFRYQFNGTVANTERIFQASQTKTDQSNSLFIARNGTGSTIYFQYSVGGAYSTAIFTGNLSQGTNYVISFVYNPSVGSGTLYCWVNGVPVTPVTGLASAITTDLLTPFTFVGCDYTGASSFTNASINTLAVYNRALSNVEIYNSYLALTTSTVNAPIEIGDVNGTPALSIAGDGRVNVTKLGQTSNVLPWPPAAMTGYVTSINGGTYVASASSELSSSYQAWYAFDRSSSAIWVGTSSLYSTSAPYAYSGTTTTTDVNGTIYRGDWVQLQVPSAISLTSYSIMTDGGNIPNAWVILGSRDGVNWNALDFQNGITSGFTASTYRNFAVNSVSTATYNYLRMVILRFIGTQATLNDLIFFGTADTAQTLTVAQPVTLSYGAQTASLTGISGDRFVPQDFSSSGLNVPAYVVSNTATVANTVQYSSMGPFAGEGSFQFNGGTGSGVSFPSSVQSLNYNIFTSDFTLEFWFYNTIAVNGTQVLASRGSIFTSSDWCIYIQSNGLLYFTYNSITDYLTSATVPTVNAWNHLAVCLKGSTLYLLVNGNPNLFGGGTSAALSTTVYSSGFPVNINGPNLSTQMRGYITNFRIVSGQALYTTSFTPPTAPLQPIQGTTQAGLPYGTVLLLRNAPAPGRVLTSKFGGANSTSVLPFPPAAMTTYATVLNSGYGQGIYVASASSEVNAGFLAWYAFDQILGNWWTSAIQYNGSAPYNYTGSVTTVDINGNSYAGEWIQIQLPVAIVPSGYTLTNSNNGVSQPYSPTKFWVLGSRDGANWSLVDSRTGVASAWATLSPTFTVTSSQAFTYFRLVSNILLGNGTAVSLSQINLNGTIEGPSISADGRLGVGVTTPTQALEVAGSAVVAGTLSAGNPLMFRNRIINGDMRVDQRGSASTPVAAAMNSYSSDRWQQEWAVTSGAMTAGQVALTASEAPYQYGFRYANKWTVTTAINLAGSAGGNYVLPKQIIEGYNIADLNWGTPYASPITVSFWFRGFAGGSYATTVRVGGGGQTTYNSLFSVNANTWTYVTYTVPPPPSGAAPTSSTTGAGIELYIANYNAYSPAAAPNTWTGNFPYQATQGALNWYSTLGNYVLVTGVQLEKGSVATPFEVRPFATELALCQRYYELVSFAAASGSTTTGTTLTLILPYTVQKRNTASQSIALVANFLLTRPNVSNYTVTPANGSISAQSYSLSGASFILTDSTQAFNFTGQVIGWVSANSPFAISCEL
jgi:hypothetical protein